jgi:hypothetical protein
VQDIERIDHFIIDFPVGLYTWGLQAHVSMACCLKARIFLTLLWELVINNPA